MRVMKAEGLLRERERKRERERESSTQERVKRGVLIL